MTVGSKMPLVSIGLPLYNAERYLGEALRSILSQSYRNFELIISDNASTDDTENICRQFASRDNRIAYYRNDSNLGGSPNFNRVYQLATGKYFKWAAHDDLISADYLAKCVAVLEADPGVVLCHSRTLRIDREGSVTGNYDSSLRTDSSRVHERFSDLVLVRHFCTLIFGVIRTSVLAKTPLMGSYIGSDRNLLAELGLYGRLHELPEYLFYRRDHPGTSLRTIPNYRDRLAWFDTSKKGRIVLPYWKNMCEFTRSVMCVPLNDSERIACLLQVLRWTRKGWKHLAIDVASPILKRTRWGYKYYAGGYGS